MASDLLVKELASIVLELLTEPGSDGFKRRDEILNNQYDALTVKGALITLTRDSQKLLGRNKETKA